MNTFPSWLEITEMMKNPIRYGIYLAWKTLNHVAPDIQPASSINESNVSSGRLSPDTVLYCDVCDAERSWDEVVTMELSDRNGLETEHYQVTCTVCGNIISEE